MRKLFTATLLLVVLFSTATNAQRTKATLTFKDGTVLRGLGRLKGSASVKFRKDKKTKATKYHFKDLEKVTFYNEDEATTYVYFSIKEKLKPKVLEEILVGEISLYRIVIRGQHAGFGIGGVGPGGFGSGGGMAFGMGHGYTIKNYYVKRANEIEVSHLGSTSLFSKNFKKAASKYFEDCPELVDKIQTKEYRKRDLRSIIEFYNTHCKK
jgi:hypothetical protein